MHVARSRNVPRAQPRPRLRLLAAEPSRRAGVEDFALARLGRLRHLGDVADQLRAQPCDHVPLLRGRRAALGRVARGEPGRQPAVEHGDGVVPHQPEQPPHPRRREQAVSVVDHHLSAVADAERPDPRGELLLRRRHVRQIGARIGDVVDVEEQRAGDARPLVLGAGVASLGGQEPGAVENPHAGIPEALRQPARRDQCSGIVLHRRPPQLRRPRLGPRPPARNARRGHSRLLISRRMRRFESRRASSSRLSWRLRPLATPIFTFARPLWLK